MKRNVILFVSCLSIWISACDGSLNSDHFENVESEIVQTQQPIFNGKRVTGDDHLNVVALTAIYYGEYWAVCTGTLISPTFVLTAGHCVDTSKSNIQEFLPRLQIGIGQNNEDMRYVYDIESIHRHPEYKNSGYNDVALIKRLRIPRIVPMRLTTMATDRQTATIRSVPVPKSAMPGMIRRRNRVRLCRAGIHRRWPPCGCSCCSV